MPYSYKKIPTAISVAALFFAVFCFFSAPIAHASNATLFFKPPVDPIGVGDEFSVPLLLDSGGQTVNAVAGDIVFSDSSLQLEHVLTANSVVTTWIDSPIVSGNSVTFSGIMPGGYESVIDPLTNQQSPGTVLVLVFSAKKEGSGTLSFSDSHLYLNDGLGTEVGLATLPYTLSIGSQGSGMKEGLNDTIPPENFVPIVSSSIDLNNGAYTLFFSTTDKESGIDHYEVSEGGKDWVRTESPYLLTDQSLRSRIRVKAVDLAGNYRIAEIGSAFPFQNSLLLIPLALLVLFVSFLYVFYKRKMKKLLRARS